MALKDTIKKMEKMLSDLTADLKKSSEKGNRAASQRVRTGSVKFAKIAKMFRKESVASEKKGGAKKVKKKVSRKKVASKAKKTTRKKATKKTTTRKKATARKKKPAVRKRR